VLCKIKHEYHINKSNNPVLVILNVTVGLHEFSKIENEVKIIVRIIMESVNVSSGGASNVLKIASAAATAAWRMVPVRDDSPTKSRRVRRT
jgi:hypothetical protein